VSTTLSQAHRVQNPELVQRYFSKIAGRYDLANRLLCGSIDVWWRKLTARQVARNAPSRVLDVATGSGDLLLEMQRQMPAAEMTGTDFCLPMLQQARAKGLQNLLLADAMRLPFAEGRFDALTVAFGLRNMEDYPGAAREFHRVLQNGGRLFILDFSMPRGWFGALYRFYLHRILPTIAGWVTGEREAYDYLGDSIETFPSGDAMCALLNSAGFVEASARPLTFGIVTVYEARKA